MNLPESKSPIVGAETEEVAYNFTFFSLINMTFGFIDGALNAMPKGGHLSYCGINLKAQRTNLINATNYYIDRDLKNAAEKIYSTLGYTYLVNYHCYYGAI
jgi:hypothetical protein